MNIAAGKFKAQCLRILDEVNETHEPVTITKRGKTVARLVPPEDTPAPSAFGLLAGTVQIHGDITKPIEEDWNAEG
jgi:prevent-host-death family protein